MNSLTDGKGGIAIKLADGHNKLPGAAKKSVEVHEGSHRLDALNENPSVAVGKPAGLQVEQMDAVMAAVSEIDASTRQLQFLDRQLQNPNLSPVERAAVEAQKNQAIRYRVEQYEKIDKAMGGGPARLPLDSSGAACQ